MRRLRRCAPLAWIAAGMALFVASLEVGDPWCWLLRIGTAGAFVASAERMMVRIERMSRVRLRDRRRRG